MGVHKSTEADRVNGTALCSVPGNERYRATATCVRCGEQWTFWRYPHRPRPEYAVCASCAEIAFRKGRPSLD